MPGLKQFSTTELEIDVHPKKMVSQTSANPIYVPLPPRALKMGKLARVNPLKIGFYD